MNDNYSIRLAIEADLPYLTDIEDAASELFQDTKFALEIDQPPLALKLLKKQQALDLIWVAVNHQNHPIGFAVAKRMGTRTHLHELSVDPRYTRQGIGTRLTQTVIDDAKQFCSTGVTLSTFRDIPWNAPFYKQLGFHEISDSDLDSDLTHLRKQEADMGLPISERIAMELALLVD